MAKLACSTVSLYLLGCSKGIVKTPSEFVTTVLRVPVSSLRIVTVAPTMAPPLSSWTDPLSVAVEV
jgi:hypothetical protein